MAFGVVATLWGREPETPPTVAAVARRGGRAAVPRVLLAQGRAGASWCSSSSTSWATPSPARSPPRSCCAARGFSLDDVGYVNKGMGLAATIVGVLFGGALMVRLGLYRALLVFGVLQAVSNLAFMWLAAAGKSYAADGVRGGLREPHRRHGHRGLRGAADGAVRRTASPPRSTRCSPRWPPSAASTWARPPATLTDPEAARAGVDHVLLPGPSSRRCRAWRCCGGSAPRSARSTCPRARLPSNSVRRPGHANEIVIPGSTRNPALFMNPAGPGSRPGRRRGIRDDDEEYATTTRNTRRRRGIRDDEARLNRVSPPTPPARRARPARAGLGVVDDHHHHPAPALAIEHPAGHARTPVSVPPLRCACPAAAPLPKRRLKVPSTA